MDHGKNLSHDNGREDASAEAGFVRTYSDGIRFYIQRHAGEQDLERRLEQTLADMLERVRNGWKPDAAGVHAHLRQLSREWQGGRGIKPMPSAHSRIQAKAEVLKDALQDCTRREMELLIHYYCHGQNLAELAAAMNIDEQEVRRLKGRLREIVSKTSSPEPLNSRAGAA